MSGVLAQKVCWPVVHTTAILVTALSLNQLRELPAICVSLVRLSRLKWKRPKWRKRSQAVYSVIYPWRNSALSPTPFSLHYYRIFDRLFWGYTFILKWKGLGEVKLYLRMLPRLTNKQKINDLGMQCWSLTLCMQQSPVEVGPSHISSMSPGATCCSITFKSRDHTYFIDASGIHASLQNM